MNLHRAKVLIILLALLTLLLFAVCSVFANTYLFMGGLLSFLSMMAVWVIFNRCPHCGKHLGRDTGIYCPHCGKKL